MANGRVEALNVLRERGLIGGVDGAGNSVGGVLSMDIAVADDVPTISYLTSPGYNASAIACTDARFTYWGGPAIQVDTSGGNSMQSKGPSFEGYQPFFSEYGLEGTTVTIRANVSANKTKWMLWVNSKYGKTDLLLFDAPTGTQDITLTFPTAKSRTLTFLSTWGPHKITPGTYAAPSTSTTIYKVTRQKGRRLGVMGDSWGRSIAGDILDGPFYRTALALGYSDIVPSIQGGRGYYNPGPSGQNRSCFVDSLAGDLLAANCQDFIVHGSINDLPGATALIGIPRADVQAKRRALYAQIRTASPGGKLYVIGTQFVQPVETAADTQELEIVADVVGYNAVYISSKGWLTGTGLEGGTTGNGNRDVLRSADGDHLSYPRGWVFWADRITSAIKALA